MLNNATVNSPEYFVSQTVQNVQHLYRMGKTLFLIVVLTCDLRDINFTQVHDQVFIY